MWNTAARAWFSMLLFGVVFSAVCAAQATGVATIRQVSILGSGNHLELEIAANQSVTPQTQTVTGPDRLVLDFTNATPGPRLRNIVVNRGEIKGVRVGLFAANPPITRVVLDLKSPQQYELFPSGKTVIVKLRAAGSTDEVQSSPSSSPSPTPAAIASASVLAAPVPAAPPKPIVPRPRVRVEVQGGDLSIWADKATLAEVLNEIHRKTGADVPIPGGAEQEQVAADYGFAPARDVLAALLNGSRFNFVLVGSAQDPTQLRSVLLTPKGTSVPVHPAYTPPEEPAPVVEDSAPEPPAPPPDLPSEPPEQVNSPVPVPPPPDQAPPDQPQQSQQ